jgi:hypothetical protein
VHPQSFGDGARRVRVVGALLLPVNFLEADDGSPADLGVRAQQPD